MPLTMYTFTAVGVETTRTPVGEEIHPLSAISRRSTIVERDRCRIQGIRP